VSTIFDGLGHSDDLLRVGDYIINFNEADAPAGQFVNQGVVVGLRSRLNSTIPVQSNILHLILENAMAVQSIWM